MILHQPQAERRIAPLAERLVRDVFDVGLTLGQSVRTPGQALQLARADATICTSLAEARYLAGSVRLYTRWAKQFQRQVQRRSRPLMAAIERSRSEERGQFGETVYLLEPNVKRSPGGLREIQLLRWVGFVRHGVAEPDGLRMLGELSHEDYDLLLRATEFLLRLRNEMHFHAGKSYDVLDREEQMRLATAYGFAGSEGLLPVEQFMREYFRLTQSVRGIVARFVAAAQGGSRVGRWLAPLVSHRFERDFRVEPHQISANAQGLSKLTTSVTEILRLVDVANLYDKPIAHETCEAIRAAVPGLPGELPPEAAERFLSLLAQPARLGQMLRLLHETGTLEKIIPAFEHARSLLQFNVYHKYTVDEHSLRAVEQATGFLRESGPLNSVYVHLKRKWLLHLALLIHDLGKGFAEDHSEVGARIALDVARRLGLAERDGEILRFLVHKHLMMAHLAFRRDTSDQQLLVRFAVDVGSPEVLEMLFLLTAADLAAVGPGVLNAWKVEVLADLFHRTMHRLGGSDPTADISRGFVALCEEVLRRLGPREDRHWFERQLAALPSAYLDTNFAAPETIALDLQELHKLGPTDVAAHGKYLAESNTVEYKVGTYESIAPGVFHRLTGALTSQGLQILSAEINTLADGLVFDRFYVHDPDHAGAPPPERLAQVSQALVAALRQADGKRPTFRRLWRPAEQLRQAALSPLPTQVKADNSTSDRYTILDIFAADRSGLLYTITRTLFELGLSVAVAKIGTYLDQVVDVFYVVDRSGKKIADEDRLAEIRDRLLNAIAKLES